MIFSRKERARYVLEDAKRHYFFYTKSSLIICIMAMFIVNIFDFLFAFVVFCIGTIHAFLAISYSRREREILNSK